MDYNFTFTETDSSSGEPLQLIPVIFSFDAGDVSSGGSVSLSVGEEPQLQRDREYTVTLSAQNSVSFSQSDFILCKYHTVAPCQYGNRRACAKVDVCLSVGLSVCLSICLLSVCLSVCVCTCMCIELSHSTLPIFTLLFIISFDIHKTFQHCSGV